MSTISLKRRISVGRRMDLYCEAGGRVRKPGYLGKITCSSTIPIYKMENVWEGRFPDPYTSCGGGDREKDTRCAVRAPDAYHPGIIMTSECGYCSTFDLL